MLGVAYTCQETAYLLPVQEAWWHLSGERQGLERSGGIRNRRQVGTDGRDTVAEAERIWREPAGRRRGMEKRMTLCFVLTQERMAVCLAERRTR